jgi:hypothetical protein
MPFLLHVHPILPITNILYIILYLMCAEGSVKHKMGPKMREPMATIPVGVARGFLIRLDSRWAVGYGCQVRKYIL